MTTKTKKTVKVVGDVTASAEPLHALEVTIASLYPSPLNPRGAIRDEDLGELVQSIREHGVLQPLVVRAKGTDSWEVIAGHRRLRAAQLAGLDVAPVVWRRNVDDATALELMLTENAARTDVHPLDEGLALQKLRTTWGRDIATLAVTTGRTERWVRQRIALTDLVDEARQRLREDMLTLSAAILLARFEPAEQREMIRLKDASLRISAAHVLSVVRRQINHAPFRTTFNYGPGCVSLDCESCPLQSDAQRRLLDDQAKYQTSSRCLSASCWSLKETRAVELGHTVVVKESYYSFKTPAGFRADLTIGDLYPEPDDHPRAAAPESAPDEVPWSVTDARAICDVVPEAETIFVCNDGNTFRRLNMARAAESLRAQGRGTEADRLATLEQSARVAAAASEAMRLASRADSETSRANAATFDARRKELAKRIREALSGAEAATVAAVPCGLLVKMAAPVEWYLQPDELEQLVGIVEGVMS